MFENWINHVRQSIGAVPRQFQPDDYPYLTPPMPGWIKYRAEPLTQQYQSHSLLFGQGTVGWGA